MKLTEENPLPLSPLPVHPNERAEGRLPRDGGGERRLPMSLRLEGFPDLLTEMGVGKQKEGGVECVRRFQTLFNVLQINYPYDS